MLPALSRHVASSVLASRAGGGRCYREDDLNVVHVIIGLNVGGAELMLLRLIEAQRMQQPDAVHRVISLTSMGPVGVCLQAAGVPVVALGMRSPMHAPGVFFRLLRLLREVRPDVLQTWMYHADLLGGLAAHQAGIQNIVWGIRTTDISKGGSRATAMVRWLCARFSHRLPRAIVCAARAAERMHVGLGYAKERMIVIPNGFDLARLQATPAQVQALRQQLGLGVEAQVVGMLGRFNAVKDQHNFVRAAGLLSRDHPEVRFLIVGRECDAENSQLAAWIAASGAPERFVLLGERQDAPVCLAAMDIFALPSRTEGFPNVLAEAMAMARPCVTTDVGDSAYVLGDCGVVVPPEDPALLAKGMARLLAMAPSERAQLGRMAQVRVKEEFSMECCARRFFDVYAELTGQPVG